MTKSDSINAKIQKLEAARDILEILEDRKTWWMERDGETGEYHDFPDDGEHDFYISRTELMNVAIKAIEKAIGL